MLHLISPFSTMRRYGIVIQHSGQPLLLLKQSHNAHNLLVSKLKYQGAVNLDY
jgi:endoribonuclease Dicer